MLLAGGTTRCNVANASYRQRLDRAASFGRCRLAYRDVASATNCQTLIAAIVPAGSVTVHTLTCLKTPLDRGAQHFLCGVLNSFVANYLVRQHMSTHVTVTIVEQLRVPKPSRQSYLFRQIVRLSRRLSAPAGGGSAGRARLQALVALLFRLTDHEFGHILGTFPLVDEAEKRAALREFQELARG